MAAYLGFFLISILFLVYSLFNRSGRQEASIGDRLGRIRRQTVSAENEELETKTFSERVIKPFLEGIGKRLLAMTPGEYSTSLEKKIVMSGRPYNWGVRNWLGVQAVATVVLPLLILLLFLQIHADFKRTLLVVGACVAMGVLLPNMILNGKIRERQKQIMKTLPDIMDLLTVSVEAGLSFDSALSRVVEKMPGVLSREFEVLLQEVKVGKSRKEAMYQMADRIGIQDFRSFISAVIQADQLGVSIGRVLRIQAEQIRLNRKQRIQEKAMKAPVKMMIPMVVFIFPSIFIVLLGPMVLNIMEILSTPK